MSAAVTSEPGTTACPRCGAPVGEEQDWCLSCGDAARTRLVPTPNWRLPIAVAAIVAGLAAIAIAIAFVEITRDPPPAPPATTTAPAAAPPATTPPPAATTAPGATTPGATTPGATTPGATTPGATTPGATTTPGAGTATTAP